MGELQSLLINRSPLDTQLNDSKALVRVVIERTYQAESPENVQVHLVEVLSRSRWMRILKRFFSRLDIHTIPLFFGRGEKKNSRGRSWSDTRVCQSVDKQAPLAQSLKQFTTIYLLFYKGLHLGGWGLEGGG